VVTLGDLERLTDSWQKMKSPGRVAVVCFHAYEFEESDSGLASFSLEKFVEIVKRLSATPGFVSLRLCDVADIMGPELTYQRYHEAQNIERLAASIYQHTWHTRLGKFLKILPPFEIYGYEKSSFYSRLKVAYFALKNFYWFVLFGIAMLGMLIFGLLNRFPRR
jgi:hypothetical protein